MKRLLSACLALAMTVSLSVVGFAAPYFKDGVCSVAPQAFHYSEDSNLAKSYTVMEYGKPVYFFPLRETADGHRLITKSSMVTGMKVKFDAEEGADLIESIQIVKIPVDPMSVYWNIMLIDDNLELYEAFADQFFDPATNDLITDTPYIYVIEMKVKRLEGTVDSDIIGTFELNKSKKGDDIDPDTGEKLDYKVKDIEQNIAFNVSYEYNYADNEFGMTVEDDVVDNNWVNLMPDTDYLFKYNYDDETEFNFGHDSAKNEGTFTIDVSGQGKNLLRFDTLPDEALLAANPDAKVFALNFNDTKFNRMGEFVYEAENLNYAYQLLSDGSLKQLGEFEGEEVAFKTRILGKYLFSDIELVPAPKQASISEVTPAAPVSNPATGGN